jgi:2-methylisocitrate lyase-like PEP mutase family enzyme
MTETLSKTERFQALHVPGKPLVLFNIWDAGSAKAVTTGGAKALATGSWSVANALGFADGEQTPLGLAIENLRRIVTATELPVTVDLESGYSEIAKTVGLALEAGAVGCNLEDSFPTNGTLRTVQDQVERLRQARQAAGDRFFINARTDVFFQKPNMQHDTTMLAEALERARAYAEVGADGLFAPGLTNLELIAQLAEASPLPLNVMVSDATPPLSALADAGVARVSYGPHPYLLAMRALEEAAREASC